MTWLSPITERRDAPRCRLVCFAHSGGSARSFAEWPASLPPEWELWAAELPGHGTRRAEPLPRQVGDVAPQLARAIEPLLDRPTILLGHSLGAILAFEVARALEHHAPRPRLVVLSARPAPDAARPGELLHVLDDATFIDRVRAIAGAERGGEWQELLELSLPVLRADFAMGERWQPDEHASIGIPVVAFAGLSDPYAPPAAMAGWARYTRAAFRAYAFPGDHFFPDATTKTLLRFVDETLAAVS